MIINIKLLIGKLIGVFCLLALSFSCNKPEDKNSSQKIVVYADEVCKEILEAEKTVFESQNPNVHLQMVYGDESASVGRIFKDSTRIVALTRPLDSNEVKYIQSKSLSAKSIKIAEDALVIIANQDHTLNTIVWDSLPSMVDKRNLNKKNLFVIVKTQSAHLKFLAQKLRIAEKQMHIYAVADSSAMFQYVRDHDNAIALVPLGWIETILSKNASNTPKKIKIISITNDAGMEVMPDQYHLSNGSYPLSKGVYLNLKGNVADGATNFVNFCMKEVGQLIVLKSGLLPVDMPSRAYYVKENNAQIK